jgi:N-methylhydantoinase A
VPFELAADIGGTFTDVVLRDGTVNSSIKVLTTYGDPADGVLRGIDEVLSRTGRDPAECRVMLHGTTLATNALIERRGAVTALLTTEGHRDAVEMALENRFEQYDVNIDRPAPLVPRPLRLPVRERLDASGAVLIELDPASVESAVAIVEAAGVASIAIGLLHAYANPAHEQAVAEIVRARLPRVSLSLSSDVCPEIREYERLSTTCANAYVKPLMGTYLASLAEKFAARGFGCPVLMMTSGGGLTTLDAAIEFPIRLVESGPAGGAILSAELSRAGGHDKTLSFDMGGTTAKLCVIDRGEPLLSRSFEVDRSYRFKKGSGLPVRIPVIEMVEIGAGGGSIASVDALGRVQVGPDSAGSEPGPACYGRGGKAATVTDADVMLGKIAPDGFAGGRLPLDATAAEQALVRSVGGPMEMTAVLAAHAVSEVVNENMAVAARAHLAEWGRGVAGRTMIAFGGAAPLHACLLAKKLKIERIVVPSDAGVGSAVGFLLAPVGYEVVRSHYMRLDELDRDAIIELMGQMYEEAAGVVEPVADPRTLVVTRRAFMRYLGQGFEIAVVLDEDLGTLGPGRLREQFEGAYERLYGRLIPGLDVEILSWTLNLSESTKARRLPEDRVSPVRRAAAEGRRPLFDVIVAGNVDAGYYERANLQPGDFLDGPALVTEPQTTVVVGSGYRATVSERGTLVIEALAGEEGGDG